MFVPNGIHMPAWTPAKEGALELMPSMQPLAKVKDSLTVMTGLTQHNAFALGDGGGDHARSAATWLALKDADCDRSNSTEASTSSLSSKDTPPIKSDAFSRSASQREASSVAPRCDRM